jgi:anti-anti-sigma factor
MFGKERAMLTMAATSLEASTSHHQHVAIVRLAGYLSGEPSDLSALASAYAEAQTYRDAAILLDFTAVDHVSGSGLALVERILEQAREDHMRLLVCGMSESDADRLRITEVVWAIGLFPDPESALEDEFAFRREVLGSRH